MRSSSHWWQLHWTALHRVENAPCSCTLSTVWCPWVSQVRGRGGGRQLTNSRRNPENCLIPHSRFTNKKTKARMPQTIPADDKTVAVVGGGLVGALSAIMLHRRGFTVHLFEGRLDWREDSRRAITEVREVLSRSVVFHPCNLPRDRRVEPLSLRIGCHAPQSFDHSTICVATSPFC